MKTLNEFIKSKEEEHYRFSEKLLNEFRNKRIGYTDIIEEEFNFLSTAIKEAIEFSFINIVIGKKIEIEQEIDWEVHIENEEWNYAVEKLLYNIKKFLKS